MADMLPVGVMRDGSYYTCIEWASHTESDPCFWVCNIIRDDNDRDGGTWGANTFGPAELVLSFFGEKQKVSRFKFYRNVGIQISVIEELVKVLDIYYTNDDVLHKLRTKDDSIDAVEWTKVATVDIERDWGWQEFVLPEPIEAKYLRFTLVCNDSKTIDWTELNQIKVFGE